MQKEFSAGGVLLNTNNELYLIKNKDGEYILPKGKLNANESAKDAAVREIKEETGYTEFKFFFEYPFYMSHYKYKNTHNNIEYDKYVTFYIFKLTSDLSKKTQEMEDEKLTGEWVSIDKALSLATHEDTKVILKNLQNALLNKPLDLVLLGGMSPHNLDWIEEVSKNFENEKLNQIVFYEHWNNENNQMDLEKEALKLKDITTNLENFSIFAKSAGIATTLKAIKDLNLKPSKCVFVGLPLNMVNETDSNLLSNLKNVEFPLYFFQNTNDPFTNFETVKKEIENLGLKNTEIIEEEGNTHDYKNYKSYLEKLN